MLAAVETMTQSVRPPAVAGMFYPADAAALTQLVDGCLGAARDLSVRPKALVAPHPGFVYSGPIAGTAYHALKDAAAIRRVVLLGPCHRVPVRGFALPSATAFATPLGDVPLDAAGIATALEHPDAEVDDAAHAQEHSLEVHLPFLQRALGAFTLVPIVVGAAAQQAIERLLDSLWGGDETLIVISSDLSHYLAYDAARQLDRDVSRKIEMLRPDGIDDEQACGRYPLKGLLARARALDLRASTLDLRNSGDTGGRDMRDRVVGYGAYGLEYSATARLDDADRAQLLKAARSSIQTELKRGQPPGVELGSFRPLNEAMRAAFVTLTLDGELRGCVGSLVAQRTLIEDVVENACKAAFSDHRFAPLTEAEAERIEISVSILSHPRRIACDSEAAALDALRPDVDGVILEAGDKRGLFLPQVWETVPRPHEFLAHLKRKAGLDDDWWSADARLFRFTTETFGTA